MWRQYAIDRAEESRRCIPTVADAMFARWQSDSHASSAGHYWLRKMVASRSTATTAAVSSRCEKKLRFKTRRDNARVLRFHYRTLLIKVNALTSLITGADETLRRGADTDESRANHTINRTRRPTGRTQEARTWSLAALLSRACALHLTSYTVAVDYWNIYESNSTLTEF